MPNYYTTRFNPAIWPPPKDDIPPGVELSPADVSKLEGFCCLDGVIVETVIETSGDAWVYVARYRLSCPAHGERDLAIERQLDWISPNEYLVEE